MKIIAFIPLFILPFTLSAQEPEPQVTEEAYEVVEPRRDQQQDSNYIHPYVEESPEFPGGMAALREYLKTNLVYPKTAEEEGIQGKCFVRFIVSEKGKISDVIIQRGVPDCPDCDKEALRLVKTMPDWKPGKNNGKAVKSYYHLPVAFRLY